METGLPYKHVLVAGGKKSGCSFKACYFPFLGGPLLSPNLDLVCEQPALLAAITRDSELHCGTFLSCDQVLLRGDPDPAARSMQS